LVLGEGFNTAWSASADGSALNDPQLVDGNANGWYLEPSSSARTVTMSWTAQRPLSVALVVSLLSVLALGALVIIDRRRAIDDPAGDVAPALDPAGVQWSRRTALATVGATVAAAALLIGWIWAPIALVALLPAVIMRRSRLAGWVGVTIVGGAALIVTAVVRSDRPYPNAGWPIRFEWLHGWTLLGVILIACSTLFARDTRSR